MKSPYTVEQGDTLKKIATAEGVSAEAIFNLNRELIGSNPDNIAAGMVLAIPSTDAEGGVEKKKADK